MYLFFHLAVTFLPYLDPFSLVYRIIHDKQKSKPTMDLLPLLSYVFRR